MLEGGEAMSYRSILFHLADDPQLEARLAFALALAQRFGAALDGLRVEASPVVATGYGEGAVYVGPELIAAQQAAEAATTQRLRELWERVCGGTAAAARLEVVQGDPGLIAAEHARTADLAIGVRGAVGGVEGLLRQPIEDLLLGGGGPVLVLPSAAVPAAALGARVLVAWNGSAPAARALKDALPFLRAAEAVELVGAGAAAAASLDRARRWLDRHGVAATARPLPESAAAAAGTALLDAAAEHRAELVVMGAYGRSRLRELVLGGATRELLAASPVPLLMSG
jgi:nucleotide-binding universal stress UspA family protein